MGVHLNDDDIADLFSCVGSPKLVWEIVRVSGAARFVCTSSLLHLLRFASRTCSTLIDYSMSVFVTLEFLVNAAMPFFAWMRAAAVNLIANSNEFICS